MVKRYEELTISDDFMFGKAMGDKVLCHSCSPLTRLQENKQRQYVEQTLCPSSSPTLLY